MKKYLLMPILAITFWLVSPVWAGALAPWQAADAVQDDLFQIQKALLFHDDASAAAYLADIEAITQQSFDRFSPEVSTFLQESVQAADQAVAEQDTLALAVASGRIKGALYWGSYELTRSAIETNDSSTAQQWLLVRDYRPSTRFSRPNANATLALQQMSTLPTADVIAALDADLLDTYQAQLTAHLQTTEDDGLVASRRAEAAGLAQAYWHILAPAYTTQNGDTATQAVTAQFNVLPAAVLANDITVTNELLQTMSNFRAAPLSAADQARRAGQLMRFLALVPVEYSRGVTDGIVLQEIEIQEAVTFMQGAQAAFADLRLTLAEMDAEQTAALESQLKQTAAHLQEANRQGSGILSEQMEDDVARITDGLTTLFPAAWLAQNSNADFDVLASVLDQVETAVAQGDYTLAESARLEAYAIFDFGPEPRLLAFAPNLVAKIDGLFWQGYDGHTGLAQAIALQADAQEIAAIRAELDSSLEEAQLTLGDLPSSPFAIATNAAIIVFREGLESVVILAALMASMVGAYVKYRRPMMLGVLLSLVATAFTWWLAQVVLTSLSAYGEKLEAIVSLIAIGILLLITNWFFHKTYWKDWMAGFHQQKRNILSAETGQFLGLVLLGFTSMYREGFETVLFLQALVLDAGTSVVLQGVAMGSIGVIIVGIITFRIQQRLPYKKMLVWTGVLIGLVLVTMVGKTIHVMQAVSWMGITPIRFITFPYWAGLWFGLYATWQGVLAQIGAAVFVIGSYFGAEWIQNRQRAQRASTRPVTHKTN
ncbi:MAG: FTR1 family protein [Anaerolineales bacterium]|nr:FTR1 family protein [Anaerolineales bacterium]